MNKGYMVQLQVAKFRDLKDFAKGETIVSCGSSSKGYGIFFVYGQRQPDSKEDFDKFMQQFIVTIETKMNW